MNKRNPDEVAEKAQEQLAELISYFDRVAARITGNHKQKDLGFLSEQTLFAAWVEFEAFLSDYVIACINKDSSSFARAEHRRVSQSVAAKNNALLAGYVEVNFPKHIKLSHARRLIDSQGRNKTFKDSSAMISWVKNNLGSTYETRFSQLTEDHLRVLDAAKAIRNYSGHRSANSRNEMNALLNKMSNHAATRDLDPGDHAVHSVGKYLRASTEAGQQDKRRIHRYVFWLKNSVQILGA